MKPPRGVARAGGGDGPFNMKKLLDTLSLMHKKDEASSASDFDGDVTLTGIMADTHKVKLDKTVKNMKTMKAPVKPPVKASPSKSPDKAVPQVSVSDVDVSVGGASGGGDSFTATMINFQKKVADESFNVMQLVVRTMTGLFPKVKYIHIHGYQPNQWVKGLKLYTQFS